MRGFGIGKDNKSVTNRQDSFDPYFDNGRKDWYQRNQREHIKLFIDSLFGKEAEFYFMTNYKNIPTFENAVIEDARLWGGGNDFQIKLNSKYFLAEVKGVREQSGSIRLTQSEFEKALEFKQDYFLVVVSNLISFPKFSCISNPLQNLDFTSKEIKSVQLNYHTSALNWSKI
ncbi:MAG: DUF3883 domain-containing protein [Treponema sp.]|nr:DUF3883 domain-containing protein [Treponema sp.]